MCQSISVAFPPHKKVITREASYALIYHMGDRKITELKKRLHLRLARRKNNLHKNYMYKFKIS